MATIDCSIGVTINVGDREFFKTDMAIRGVDTDLPVEAQIEAAMTAMPTVFNKLSEILSQKAREYIGAKTKK